MMTRFHERPGHSAQSLKTNAPRNPQRTARSERRSCARLIANKATFAAVNIILIVRSSSSTGGEGGYVDRRVEETCSFFFLPGHSFFSGRFRNRQRGPPQRRFASVSALVS